MKPKLSSSFKWFSFVFVWAGLVVYSFCFLDLNLTLYRFSWFQKIKPFFNQLGYYQRPLSTLIFLVLAVSLTGLYFNLIKKKIPQNNCRWINRLLPIIGLGLVSYPMFSHDIFNYIFAYKMVKNINSSMMKLRGGKNRALIQLDKTKTDNYSSKFVISDTGIGTTYADYSPISKFSSIKDFNETMEKYPNLKTEVAKEITNENRRKTFEEFTSKLKAHKYNEIKKIDTVVSIGKKVYYPYENKETIVDYIHFNKDNWNNNNEIILKENNKESTGYYSGDSDRLDFKSTGKEIVEDIAVAEQIYYEIIDLQSKQIAKLKAEVKRQKRLEGEIDKICGIYTVAMNL